MSGALLVPGPARPLDLLGVGECSLDHVLRVPALTGGGREGAGQRLGRAPGRPVATAVLCAVRLGLRAAYAGAVGHDASAQAALSPLVAAGVDLSRVERVRGARTRTAVILVEEGSGERVVLGYRDARLAAAGPALGALALDTTRLVLRWLHHRHSGPDP